MQSRDDGCICHQSSGWDLSMSVSISWAGITKYSCHSQWPSACVVPADVKHLACVNFCAVHVPCWCLCNRGYRDRAFRMSSMCLKLRWLILWEARLRSEDSLRPCLNHGLQALGLVVWDLALAIWWTSYCLCPSHQPWCRPRSPLSCSRRL